MRATDLHDAARYFEEGPPLHERLDMRQVHHRIVRRFERLRSVIRVQFTDVDPYDDFGPMRAQWSSGVLYVFAGHNEALPREVHLALRAVHDNDHCEQEADFTAGGEWRAVRAAASREPALACLWSSEILGQVCTYLATGRYPAHRLVAGMNRWLGDLALPACITTT